MAQTPTLKTFASSSDVAAMIAKAKAERKPDRPIFAQPILQLASYTASLEYRGAAGRGTITLAHRL